MPTPDFCSLFFCNERSFVPEFGSASASVPVIHLARLVPNHGLRSCYPACSGPNAQPASYKYRSSTSVAGEPESRFSPQARTEWTRQHPPIPVQLPPSRRLSGQKSCSPAYGSKTPRSTRLITSDSSWAGVGRLRYRKFCSRASHLRMRSSSNLPPK